MKPDMPDRPDRPDLPEHVNAPEPGAPGGPEHLGDALEHLSTAVEENSIAVGAARGLVYSIMETLGTLVGDPDLPEHARSGYEGLLETAREIRARIEGDDSAS
ncbi:hypothetical protein L602_000200000650 [Cupriavidus gilardii J11]|uniref:Major surface protein 3 n=1 Tax=Cupriavidus gilardii J11 TaxID=936133 RepID=A0A562BN68_9BURK|nr:hypothetical protein L602_000200000650 [Cupriavidus gilardii J11]